MTRYLLLLLLTGCSASYHMKRADYHYNKARQMDSTLVRVDTVLVDVIVPEVRTDTTFLSTLGDTVYIEKDRLRIKYVKLPSDSVYISGECRADTVIVEVPVERGIIRESFLTTYQSWFKHSLGMGKLVFWVLHIGALLLLIYVIFRRIVG